MTAATDLTDLSELKNRAVVSGLFGHVKDSRNLQLDFSRISRVTETK